MLSEGFLLENVECMDALIYGVYYHMNKKYVKFLDKQPSDNDD